MRTGEPPKEVTLVGEVVPANLDNEGNVIGIHFRVNKDLYVIELNEIGEELFDYMDEGLKVTGISSVAKNGVRRIRVKTYEVLSNQEEPDASMEDPGPEEGRRG